MKRQLLVLIALATLATALTTNAFGQAGKRVAANVTFDFQIGDRTFPAGEYWIGSLSRQSDNILRIRSIGDANRNEIILANHSREGKRQTPRLVFHKYGENYFLSNIFLDTEQWGYSIRPSRRQRESTKDLRLASLKTIEVPLAR
jgi:hypothetical protein